MDFEYKDDKLKLEYTYNSFKFMDELDLEELMEIDRKPFKMITITEMLLLGALNNDPKVIIDDLKVSEIVQHELENGKLVELLEILVELLQESSFFKNLQVKSPKKGK